jgi:hypothetical protein
MDNIDWRKFQEELADTFGTDPQIHVEIAHNHWPQMPKLGYPRMATWSDVYPWMAATSEPRRYDGRFSTTPDPDRIGTRYLALTIPVQPRLLTARETPARVYWASPRIAETIAAMIRNPVRPLKPETLARLNAGLRRYGGNPRPELINNSY